MELAGFIELARTPPALDFLVIGGFAVAAHGHTRATFDVDFLARQPEREQWKFKLGSTGMQVEAETMAFIQFMPLGGESPLDLMLVDNVTFQKFLERAEEKDFGNTRALVPSLDHMIALKLHALKQSLPHRTSKDADDVIMLARRNQLDLSQKHYQELFLKYGTKEIYETLLRVLRL